MIWSGFHKKVLGENSKVQKSICWVSRPFKGERTVFSINGAGKTGYPHAKE